MAARNFWRLAVGYERHSRRISGLVQDPAVGVDVATLVLVLFLVLVLTAGEDFRVDVTALPTAEVLTVGETLAGGLTSLPPSVLAAVVVGGCTVSVTISPGVLVGDGVLYCAGHTPTAGSEGSVSKSTPLMASSSEIVWNLGKAELGSFAGLDRITDADTADAAIKRMDDLMVKIRRGDRRKGKRMSRVRRLQKRRLTSISIFLLGVPSRGWLNQRASHTGQYEPSCGCEWCWRCWRC
jgi:hypothetical protein